MKLNELKQSIKNASGYLALRLTNEESLDGPYIRMSYIILYLDDDVVKTDHIQVIVKDKGLVTEDAMFLNCVPVILEPLPQEESFRAAVIAKKVELLSTDSSILRIDVRRVASAEKYGFIALFKVVGDVVERHVYMLYDNDDGCGLQMIPSSATENLCVV